ncbi:MAG: site-specific integrase [Deltaproteobacteria bacterium]|jgi:integrase|nr:site-specific integrase [Deltaproteobacteria bacterium]
MSGNIRLRGKHYYYDFMIDGKRYKGSTRTGDKKLAEHIADTIKADLLRKKHDLPSNIKYQFKDAWGIYIKSQSYCFKTEESKINSAKHFLPVFQNMPLDSITTDKIENYRLNRKLEITSLEKNSGKRESEISFRSVNIEIAALSHFFNYCIKKSYLDKNPCAGIKKLNELSRIKTLADEDIEKLISGATNKLTRDLITFLIYTGCRKGEALNLKWDDVDLKNEVIAVKATKTKYDRYIPISKPLKELLSGIEKNQDCLYVFNKNGAKLTDFKRSFHTACHNAGFKDMHIHDLRHIFASKMVKDGISLFITGELLGHRTTQMTKRYSHLVPGTLKKAVDDVWGRNHG